ncbi:MAG TPA: oligoendopeptidase F [Firmicutes bacterium]|nr:oligoendopeptidase F [Candidatus Fermentithermobacillaceae bacterium]
MQKRLHRSEVPPHLTWNLDDIFPSVDAWETELASVAQDIPTVTKYKGRFAEGPSVLYECLEAAEALERRLRRVVSYASLKQSGDGTDPANQAAMGRASALAAKVQAELSFIRSEALALPDGTLERYLKEHAPLKDFERMIGKMVKEKPHLLHPETEVALASLSEVLTSPSLIYNRSKAADMTFEPVLDKNGVSHPMSFALYEETYEKHPDVVLRRNAYASFTKGLKAYQNTYGATWGTEVKKHVVLAKLRGYESATHMLLDAQEVDIDVYNRLHDIILKEIAPHMRRYARLRKQVLGLDKMLYCDIEAPLDPDFSPKTTFEEAAELIVKGLSVLGPEYTEIIAKGMKSRWIDLADNIGKSTGAFCNTVPGAHPYILVTWQDSMRNALVLSHELGHGGHGVLSQRYQRFYNTRSTMFFTEAPSTINELLVGNYIMSQSDDPRMRRWLNMQFLMTYHHNFVRHLIEGELQRRIYVLAEKGQPITASVLSRVQGEILEEFWGGEVEIDDGARLTWMRQPHYYMGLYPYSYSAGLTIGTAVAKAIREEGQPAVDRWLAVLKAGGTKPPIELAKMAGVDMTKPEPILEAVAYVGSLVDEVVKGFGVDV